MQDIIRMTYDASPSHPDDITKSEPYDLAPGRTSSGWLMVYAGYHTDEIRCYPKPSEWYNGIWVSHPDYLLEVISHPNELRQIHYVIRMTYAPVLMSSGWDKRFQISQRPFSASVTYPITSFYENMSCITVPVDTDLWYLYCHQP